MPLGTFLDSLPSLIFIGAHAMFLALGIWAAKTATARAAAFWLYAVSQVLFLTFFGGVITMKMAVLLEQTLIAVLVVMLALRPASAVRP
jgi:hypothetical protein